MRRRQKRLVRVVALILAALLLVGAVVSVVLSTAVAEEPDARDSYVLEAEFFEDAQALRVSQRLVYTNRTGQALDRVEFSLYGNMFRRESALMYENEALLAAFPEGYAPGGLEISAVRVNGEQADWGMIGENELFLRVACDLPDGHQCVFAFDYTLLLTQNGAFLGAGDGDWRLRGFYLQALKFEGGAFVAPTPLQHANYVYADRADYTLRLTLPARYHLAGPGAVSARESGDGVRTWTIEASGLRELTASLSMRWRESQAQTALGTPVRVLASSRAGARRALESALAALELYEEWFGALGAPLTIAQSDYALGALALEGLVWASEEALFDETAIRRAVARQFFGYGAYAMPTGDAWLSDSICEYLAYLAIEELQGRDAFLAALNRDLAPTVQYTLPGGLEITSDATLFTAAEYDTVVCKRGALVMHELRASMGKETLLVGLRLFYQRGRAGDVMGEYDFLDALDEASGGDWEAFLTDWLFNIADYYQMEYIDRIE